MVEIIGRLQNISSPASATASRALTKALLPPAVTTTSSLIGALHVYSVFVAKFRLDQFQQPRDAVDGLVLVQFGVGKKFGDLIEGLPRGG